MRCMSTVFAEALHPRDVAGKFAEKSRTAPELQLSRVNDAYPIPQADRLTHVSTVLDAISSGADTTSSIADVLGLDERQGGYYASAAAYLGLAERSDHVPGGWALTAYGEELANLDVPARAVAIRAAAASTPTVSALAEDDEDGAVAAIRSSVDYADETTERRMSTARAWLTDIQSSDFADRAAAQNDEALLRLPAAALRAATERSIARARTPQPRPVCPECMMELPLSGACGC